MVPDLSSLYLELEQAEAVLASAPAAPPARCQPEESCGSQAGGTSPPHSPSRQQPRMSWEEAAEKKRTTELALEVGHSGGGGRGHGQVDMQDKARSGATPCVAQQRLLWLASLGLHPSGPGLQAGHTCVHWQCNACNSRTTRGWRFCWKGGS